MGEGKKLESNLLVRVCRLDDIALTEEWNLGPCNFWATICGGGKKVKAFFCPGLQAMSIN